MNKIIEKYNIAKDFKPEIFGDLVTFCVSTDKIAELCTKFYREHKLQLKTITAFDERSVSGSFKIMYVFGLPKENIFLAPYILVKSDFPSITPFINEASLYERKIKTFFGLEPLNHPDPRSLILHENWPKDLYPLRKDFECGKRPKEANEKYSFNRVEGEGIYEIPVGPVHAGIIEPGHFRFSVLGEEIMLLEARLGFSHKGSEKLFERLSLDDKIKLSERISGDSSFGHSLAFCLTIEKLAGIKVSKKAEHLRIIYSELERLANHFGDIGAIMIDTGFNFGGANGARLRETIMQINESLTGSRFLRGVNTIGGVNKDITKTLAEDVYRKLNVIEKDFSEVIKVALDTTSLFDRLNNTGRLNQEVARDFGVVGVAGRAAGISRDARMDYPYSSYEEIPFDIPIEKSGDVFSRFMVRIKEVKISFDILNKVLNSLSDDEQINISKDIKLPLNSYAISIVEGWRGNIVYVVSTDKNGSISRVDVRDPSFLNWNAVGLVGPGNIVPDFPLINKSFNLSYSGNDL